MVEGVETEILCSICDEVCKRGAKLKCCGVRACRACAVVKINKNKNCWNEECGKEVNAATELINDVLLRKAVDYFNKNGKLNLEHKKQLAKGKDGSWGVASKKTQAKAKSVVYADVADKFSQPCKYGAKCKLKGRLCQFVHDDKEEAKETSKSLEPKKKICKFGPACYEKECKFLHPERINTGVKICRFGARCTTPNCRFNHPNIKKVDKMCKFGDRCNDKDCRFLHGDEVGQGDDLRSRLESKRMNEMMFKRNMMEQEREMMNMQQMQDMGYSQGMDMRRGNMMEEDMNMGMTPRQMGVGMGMGSMGGGMNMREDMNICGSMGGGMPMRMRDPGMGRMRRGSMDDVEGSIATMRKMKENLESMMESVMRRGGRSMDNGGGFAGPMETGGTGRMAMRDPRMSGGRGYGGGYGGGY